ncbi:MAG TPA: glucokinase [Acidobacteriaceae bacterium]|jgi:glucokinase|nr:glucokinase [Acidobacteriaceae bacterium]
MILAGDVGGTKVHLALYGFEHGQLVHVRDERFPAHEFSGLEEIVRRFLSESASPAIDAACFGVPGPVRGGRLKLTNLPWVLDGRQLSADLNITHLFLINDLEANGYGIPELTAEQIFTLNEGDAGVVGHRALVSAGTGLGEGVLVWNGKTHVPMASEGGHSDFAARNRLEIDLLLYLTKKLGGRVSFERVVSGPGLTSIYCFLRDEKHMEEPAWLRDRMAEEDPNAVIGEVGESGKSELCAKTLEMFCAAYGAEAGNMVLKVLATGGMYLGGGIAPKILKTMQAGCFMQAFKDKGRLSDLLIQTPVRVILESRAALMGAAAYAEARAAEISGKSVRAASL